MIRSFCDKETELLAGQESSKRFRSIERSAIRKLRYLDAAGALSDLREPPGNRLEALQGSRNGQWSIRINLQWRICFKWKDGDAYDVEITDYH